MIDYMDKFRFNQKTALVIGGLGLIGREVSLALAQAGAKVLVVDINEEAGKEFLLENKSYDIQFFNFDITEIDNLKENITRLWDEEGPIHVLINTSYPRTKDWGEKLENIKFSSWQKNVDMQMNSCCLISREIAELMKMNKISGSIINYGSTYGVVSPDFEIYRETEMTSDATYAAIKGGIIQFSRYLAAYYGKYGIRSNCLCPGGIFDNQNPLFMERYNRRTALKRMGRPEEMAAATLFLASDAASYITGTTFMVDGGWTCI
jgi:NAD(P)-dependent dehydrogenase (short-subunit alcohol dehydrogenase family)